MVICLACFDNDPIYIRLLKAINQIAFQQDGKELNNTLRSVLVGISLGFKPSQLSVELKLDSNYIRIECTKIYKYINILVGKKDERGKWKKAYERLNQWVKDEQTKMNCLNLSLADISVQPKIEESVSLITAEEFINSARKELLKSVRLSFLPSDINKLDQQISNIHQLEENGQYLTALKNYHSVIVQIFSRSSDNGKSYFGVLVKIVSCFNKLESYANVEKLGGFALEYVKYKTGRADLYSYIARAWHELYIKSNNLQHLRNARNNYRAAHENSQNDCVILWNIFALYIEAQNRENQGIDYFDSMKLAWQEFLYHQQNMESNFKDFRRKIIEDKNRILKENPNNKWLLDNLSKI